MRIAIANEDNDLRNSPPHQTNGALENGGEKKDATFRKVRSILNKITPEKFDKLGLELLNVGINSQVILRGIILLIFEKALDEPKYSSLYAQLCHRLCEDAPNFEPPGSSQSTFRRLLLNKCRDEFENRSKATEIYDRDDLTPDEEEQRQIAKSKMLGNIKFIGELGKLDMLHEGILHKCIKQLLEKHRNSAMADMSEDLECLSQILKTVGRRLDTAKARAWMDQYFERIKMFIASEQLPSRIRFMLLDVIELRENTWEPRRNATENKPQTMKEVRLKAIKDGLIPNANKNKIMDHNSSSGNGQFFGPVINGGFSRSNGFNDIFGTPLTDFMGSGGIGTGPGVINMDSFNSAYSSNMGRQRNGQSQGSYPSGQYGRKQENYNNGMNSGPRSFSPTDNNLKNRLNNVKQNELPPRFRKQQQTPTNNMNGFNGSPDVPTMYIPGAGGGSVGPNLPPMIVPGVGVNGGIKKNNSPSPDEISLRPARNFAPSLKPSTPSLLPKSSQGSQQNPLRPPLLTDSSGPAVTMMSKTPSITIKNVTTENKNRSNKHKNISKEELNKFLEDMMDNYFDTKNIDESLIKMKDLKPSAKYLPIVVFNVMQLSMSKTDEARDDASKLITAMKENSIINSENFVEGLAMLLDRMKELEVETPLVRSYIAKYAAQAVVAEIAPLSEMADPMSEGLHYPLFLIILQQIRKLADNDWLSNSFTKSKIDLLRMLPDCDRNEDRMIEILDDRELSFLYPLLRCKSEMWKIIKFDPNPTLIYKWIKDNVEPFLQADLQFINILFSNILKYIGLESKLAPGFDPNTQPIKTLIDKEKELMSKFKSILQAFLDNQPHLQLIAIYTLQVHCHSHSYPKGMLLRMFMHLYDMEIVDEDVFLRWKEEVNDSYPGKGKSLFQVNTWLTWLEEAEEESEED